MSTKKKFDYIRDVNATASSSKAALTASPAPAASNMASSTSATSTKQKNMELLKNNPNMDIADLFKMTKGMDDSIEYYEEEIIEEEIIEDDLDLFDKNKTSGAAFQIPNFAARKAAPAPAPASPPVFVPPKIPIAIANKKKNAKEIDGSKLLLLQSAEQKINEAHENFHLAIQEGSAIVSLLEFMVANSHWEEDEIEEVDPKEWEVLAAFQNTMTEAQSIMNRLEQAKHRLMGTRNKGESGNIKETPSTTMTAAETTLTASNTGRRTPSPETTSTGKPFRPPLAVHREPSFRAPDLATLQETEDEASESESTLNSSNPDLTKAKEEFLRVAREGAALATKLKRPEPVYARRASLEEIEFLLVAKEGAAVATKRSSVSAAAPKAPENNELANAKTAMMNFAKEGVSLAAKLEKRSLAQRAKGGTQKHDATKEGQNELVEAKQAMMDFAKEGASLAAKLNNQDGVEAEQKAVATAMAAVEEIVEEIIEIEESPEDGLARAKKAMMAFATEGAILASKLKQKNPAAGEKRVNAAEMKIQDTGSETSAQKKIAEPVAELSKASKEVNSFEPEKDVLESRTSTLEEASKKEDRSAPDKEDIVEAAQPVDEPGKASEETKETDNVPVEVANDVTELITTTTDGTEEATVGEVAELTATITAKESEIKPGQQATTESATPTTENVHDSKAAVQTNGSERNSTKGTYVESNKGEQKSRTTSANMVDASTPITAEDGKRENSLVADAPDTLNEQEENEQHAEVKPEATSHVSNADGSPAAPTKVNAATSAEETTSVDNCVGESAATADTKAKQEPSSENIDEARQSFLLAAQDGAVTLSQLENFFASEKKAEENAVCDEKKKQSANDDENASEEDRQKIENSELLTRARGSLLAAAEEGTALVAIMDGRSKKENNEKKAAALEAETDVVLSTSQKFKDAAKLVDRLNTSGSSLTKKSFKETDEDVIEEDGEIEEIVNGVEASKKALLQIAEEGVSLISTLKSKVNSSKQSNEEEEVVSDVVEEDSLAAAKSEFLSFQKELNKKVAPMAAKDDDVNPMITRTESEEADC